MNDVLKDWANLDVNDQKTKQEFDDMMGDYDSMIKDAGYDLPERLSQILPYICYIETAGNILDLCCGTGQVGEAFYHPKCRNITGIDFSDNINIAYEKGVYDLLIQHNVNDLPKIITHFDLVFMIGSLTYFKPKHVFQEIINKLDFDVFIFSHRIDLIDDEFNNALKLFSSIKVLENIPYLPNSEFYKNKPINLYAVKK